MTFIDGVILVVVGVFLGFVLRSRFKKRKNPCAGCAFAKQCDAGCVLPDEKGPKEANKK
ncbi:MAG: FeoB-associated Cys-rich membrane protein [Acholeplasmataceae bacterium]|nr:FeoB-associated Cys-rich membrane protein [Acholeplasmataceae bacterium]